MLRAEPLVLLLLLRLRLLVAPLVLLVQLLAAPLLLLALPWAGQRAAQQARQPWAPRAASSWTAWLG